VEVDRPRLSTPLGPPPEVWLVVALLCGAGLSIGVPVVQALPDALGLVTAESIGLLVLALVAALALLALTCFLLAWQVTRADPVARVVTVVVAGSLAFGLLLGDGVADFEGKVTLLCSVAAVVCLTVPARAKEFFARQAGGAVPAAVVGAEAAVLLLAAILLLVGIACVRAGAQDAEYAVGGLGMVGVSIAGVKVRRRLETPDQAARALMSALMAGAVVAILVATEGSVTGPLFIPLGMAVSIVLLLWLPQESQAFYRRRPSQTGDDDPADDVPPLDATGPRMPPPPTPGARPVDDVAVAALPLVRAPDRPSSIDRPLPPPVGLSPSTTPPPPPAAPSPPPPAAPTQPPPTPPDWLLAAPPPGFWPSEPGPVAVARPRYELVDVDASAADGHQSSELGFRFDTTSWFPAVDDPGLVRGVYLVAMVMFDDGGEATAFRGTSTLVVMPDRLVGVCARGDSEAGRLDPDERRVAAWLLLLDQVDWVRAEGPADGGRLTLKGWDADRPWATLSRPRVVEDGAFRPAAVSELVDVVNRAKQADS
jgi:hypothetical protein